MFASVRIRKWVSLPFFMPDELLTKLMLLEVAVLRSKKRNTLVKA